MYINNRWLLLITCGGGRVGLRRRFKAPISSEARVRIPSSAHCFAYLGFKEFVFSFAVVGSRTKDTFLLFFSLFQAEADSFSRKPVYARYADPSALTFILSSHRQSYKSLFFDSQFIVS